LIILTRHRIFMMIIFAVLAWKMLRTDWIVKCRYEYGDTDPPPTMSYGMEFYHPPQSPILDPPSPAKLTGRADAKWTEWQFFEGGGSWGPVEEPHLHVDWLLMLGKLAGCLLMAGVVVYAPRDRLRPSKA
jgi:hypothetical protein